MPTLILHGGKDPLFPKDHGEILKASIKGAQLKVIKDMGHIVTPRLFPQIIQEIDGFIRS